MSRKDRLYQLIQILKDGGLHRASDLAETVGVSLRTLYRDMDTLVASGVPVRGERGVGYQITAAFTLPPLNLTKAELEALHMGLTVIASGENADLATAARALAARIDGVLPQKGAGSGWHFATYPFGDAARGFEHLPPLRTAIRVRQKIDMTYQDQTRTIRPLGLEYWGRLWMLNLWCETQNRFDSIPVDKINTLTPRRVRFVDEVGKTLADFHINRKKSAQD